MKTLSSFVALFVALSLFPATAGAGQFKVLKAFPSNALEGKAPNGNGVILGGKFYGVTYSGGAGGKGVLFSVNIDGTDFKKLRDFSSEEGSPNQNWWGSHTPSLLAAPDRIVVGLDTTSSNADGIYSFLANSATWSKVAWLGYGDPYTPDRGSSPLLGFHDSGMIYGVCYYGGPNSGKGTVFRCSLDGEQFETLYTFTGGADGSYPGQIIDGGSVIYGYTTEGGIGGEGTIFKINKNGTGFQTLKQFTSPASVTSLVLLGGKLFGCSCEGGTATGTITYPCGFIFTIDPAGTAANDYGYKEIKTFGYNSSNSALSSPFYSPSRLATDGSVLYVVAMDSAQNSRGGLISLKPDGSGQQTLATFLENGATGYDPTGIIYSGGKLYGCNGSGGAGGMGTLWCYDPGTSTTPPPYTGPLYGAVTFGGTVSSTQTLPASVTTSRGVTTTVNRTKMLSTALNNAFILKRASQSIAAFNGSTTGYSIVCTENAGVLEFYAYKKGASLISLAPLIGLTETGLLQAPVATDTYTAATGTSKTSETGTEKIFSEGNFLGMQVALRRTVNYKSATAVINGTNSTYYPGTSTGAFFGVDTNGTEFVEGTFSIAAPASIQVQQ